MFKLTNSNDFPNNDDLVNQLVPKYLQATYPCLLCDTEWS